MRQIIAASIALMTSLGTVPTTAKTSAVDRQILADFYTNEDFAKNVYAEIHAAVMLASAAIDTEDLKEIFPKRCEQLMDKIANVVRTNVSEILLQGPEDIQEACPQWQNLSIDDRTDFYVALVTSMAYAESSCNNKARNYGATNGTAYGLWQSRKPLSPERGAKWVMKQLERQVQQSGLLFWSDTNLNYWAVLNPTISAHKVQRLLKKIPACVVEVLAESTEAREQNG